jgi:hypothetical protein
MRSLTADAAIIALPSLAAAGGAIWGAEALFALAAERGAALSPSLLLPTMSALAFLLTWMSYYVVVGLLAYRATSTSNAVILFLVLVSLLTVLVLLNQPPLAVPILTAAAGALVALRLLRLRPRRPARASSAQKPA